MTLMQRWLQRSHQRREPSQLEQYNDIIYFPLIYFLLQKSSSGKWTLFLRFHLVGERVQIPEKYKKRGKKLLPTSIRTEGSIIRLLLLLNTLPSILWIGPSFLKGGPSQFWTGPSSGANTYGKGPQHLW